MAFVNTDNVPECGNFENVAQIINALRGAAADELSAASLYRKMAVDLKKSGASQEIIERLQEIETDEQQHLGSLLWMVNQLDSSIGENMQKGAEGE